MCCDDYAPLGAIVFSPQQPRHQIACRRGLLRRRLSASGSFSSFFFLASTGRRLAHVRVKRVDGPSTSSSCAAWFLPERRGPLADMGWVQICACARGWSAPAKLERLREEETQFPLKGRPLRRRRRPPSRLGRIRRIADRSDHACLRGAAIHLDQAPQAPQIQADRPGVMMVMRFDR